MTDLRISIGRAVVRENPKSAYVVIADLMHGDADGFSTAKFGPFDSTTGIQQLENILRALESLKDVDAEEYDTSPGWPVVNADWDSDTTSNYQFPAAYTGHQVRYFDGNGQEFEVSYSWAQQGA